MLTTGMLWTLIIGGLLLVESAIVTYGNTRKARALVRLQELELAEKTLLKEGAEDAGVVFICSTCQVTISMPSGSPTDPIDDWAPKCPSCLVRMTRKAT